MTPSPPLPTSSPRSSVSCVGHWDRKENLLEEENAKEPNTRAVIRGTLITPAPTPAAAKDSTATTTCSSDIKTPCSSQLQADSPSAMRDSSTSTIDDDEDAAAVTAAKRAKELSNLEKFCLIAEDYEATGRSPTSSHKAEGPQAPPQPTRPPKTPVAVVAATPSPTENCSGGGGGSSDHHRSSPPQMRDAIVHLREEEAAFPQPSRITNETNHNQSNGSNKNRYYRGNLFGAPNMPLPLPSHHYPPPPPPSSHPYHHGRANATATPVASPPTSGQAHWPQGSRPDSSWHSPYPHRPPSPYRWNNSHTANSNYHNNLTTAHHHHHPHGSPQGQATGAASSCSCGCYPYPQPSIYPGGPSPPHWRPVQQRAPDPNHGKLQQHQPPSIQTPTQHSINQHHTPSNSNNTSNFSRGEGQDGSRTSESSHANCSCGNHHGGCCGMSSTPPPCSQFPQQQHQHSSTPTTTPMNGYKELEVLLQNAPPTMRSALWTCVQRIVREHVQEFQRTGGGGMANHGMNDAASDYHHHYNGSNNATNNHHHAHLYNKPPQYNNAFQAASPSPASMDNQFAVVEKTSKLSRKRGLGGNDLSLRREIKKLKTVREKMELLQEIETMIRTDGLEDSKLTEGARTFVCRSLRPIMSCFTKHCHSDLEIFCLKWPKLAVSSFACNGIFPECFKTLVPLQQQQQEQEPQQEPLPPPLTIEFVKTDPENISQGENI